MDKLLLFVIMIIIEFLSFTIFMKLDYKYDIKIKYFSFVSKNKIFFIRFKE